MFSVIEHIEYLMTRHDCVVIPGWGAFIANCSPARYDADREVMERPHRSIGFNASVSHNDGMLAQSLLRREGMDYDEAMRFIADTVTTFRQQLAMGCEVSMGRLGYFRANEGLTEFVPFDRDHCCDAYYGLDDLPIKTVAVLEQHCDEQEAEDAIPRAVAPSRNLFTRRVGRIAASAAVLIGLGVLLSTPIIVDRSNQQLAGMAPTVTAPQAQVLGTTVEQGVSQQGITLVETSTPTIASVGNEAGRYYMVIATLRNQQEMDAFKAANPALGPYMKVLDYKGMMCVYVARSDDYGTLMGLRAELPEGLRDIWIYS